MQFNHCDSHCENIVTNTVKVKKKQTSTTTVYNIVAMPT